MSLLSRILSRGHHKGPFRLHWLSSDLAISRQLEPPDWPTVSAAGISGVVDLRAEAGPVEHLAAGNRLRYLRLPIQEGLAPTQNQLNAATDWIVARIADDGPVLVFCREGRGRSPLVACAALVRLGVPLSEAYRLLFRARPEVALSDEQAAMLERWASAWNQPS